MGGGEGHGGVAAVDSLHRPAHRDRETVGECVCC